MNIKKIIDNQFINFDAISLLEYNPNDKVILIDTIYPIARTFEDYDEASSFIKTNFSTFLELSNGKYFNPTRIIALEHFENKVKIFLASMFFGMIVEEDEDIILTKLNITDLDSSQNDDIIKGEEEFEI